MLIFSKCQGLKNERKVSINSSLGVPHIRQVQALFRVSENDVAVFQNGAQFDMKQGTSTTCQDYVVPG